MTSIYDYYLEDTFVKSSLKPSQFKQQVRDFVRYCNADVTEEYMMQASDFVQWYMDKWGNGRMDIPQVDEVILFSDY